MRRLGPSAVQAFAIGLRWGLVAAGQYIDMVNNNPWSRKTLKWRAEGYQALNRLISDPHADHDQILVALLFAKLADHMLGDPALNKLHLKGLDALVQARGGLQSFAFRADALVRPHYIMVQYAFVEFEMPTSKEAKATKSCVQRDLNSLRTWVQSSIAHLLNSSEEPQHNNYTHQGIDQKATHTSHCTLTTLLQAKADVLSFAEGMGAACEKEASYPQTAGYFLFLHQLLSTLASFEFRYSEANEFLCRLKCVIESSSSGCLVPAISPLWPMALTQMISFARFEVFTHHPRGQAMEKEIRLCAAGIDAMKEFAMLGSESRVEMVTRLHAWLWFENFSAVLPVTPDILPHGNIRTV